MPDWVRFTWQLPGRRFDAAPAPGYALRAGTVSDVPAMVRVVAAAYASDPVWASMRADIERRVGARTRALVGDPGAHFAVAACDGTLVGVSGAVVSHETGQNFVTGICVDPAHQGRGIGTALLADCLGWLRDRGLPEATVITERHATAALVYARFDARRDEGADYADPPRTG